MAVISGMPLGGHQSLGKRVDGRPGVVVNLVRCFDPLVRGCLVPVAASSTGRVSVVEPQWRYPIGGPDGQGRTCPPGSLS